MLKLARLVLKVVNHAVDLLDHRLEKDFDFDPDFNGGDRASPDAVTGFKPRNLPGMI